MESFTKILNDYRDLLYLKLLLGLIVSTVIYLVLNIYFQITVTSISDPRRSIIQAISYILIPVAWYIFVIHGQSYSNSLLDFSTTKKGRKKRNLLKGFIEGNLIYLLISLPLWVYCTVLNTSALWWFRKSKNPDYIIWLVYAIISVTSVELTTKGYVMIPLLERGDNKLTIFVITLTVWCLGHIVEFIWLSSYVSNVYTISILVQAGVFSIYAVLRSENIYGVWSGHIMLNVCLILILNI